MKPKKPRKPAVVEVTFRLLTAETNVLLRLIARNFARGMATRLSAKLVRKPTVERVGKR